MRKYTKKETDLWGREKEVHYEDGKKVGETRYRESLWGSKVQDHYDSSGNKTGETKREEGLFSDRAVHYDSEGKKTGYTKNDETFYGKKIQRHYNADGNEMGKSYYEEGFFGSHKKVHESQYFKGGGSGQGRNYYRSYKDSSMAFKIGLVFAVLIFVVIELAMFNNFMKGGNRYELTQQANTQQQVVSHIEKENTEPIPAIHIGKEAIWQPTDDIVHFMRNECENNKYPDECLVAKMEELGASEKAVALTRYLLKLEYPFCFMSSFKELGRIDIAEVYCPFMANTMGFTFLVNGLPSIVQVGDFDYLGRINLENHPVYTTIRQKFPEAKIWSTSADLFIKSQNLPNGGQRFIYNHLLLNGCRACEISGVASIGYDFDSTGRFIGVQLLKLSEPKN